MRLSSMLSAAALLGGALAEFDFAVVTKFPLCALECATTVILPTCKNLTDIPNCLCRSDELQFDISTCVIGACNVTQQYASLTILQEEICKGIPQSSRQVEVRRAVIILAAFTYPIIILRFVSRIIVARKIWWDDWLILASVVFMMAFTVLPLYPAIGLGLGKHFYAIFYVVQLFYVILQVLSKVSILLLYVRIFPTQKFRLVLKFAIAFMLVHGAAFFFIVAFQCLPVRSLWDREIPGKCVDLQALIYAGAGLSIFEDFAIMLLPIFELKGLNLSRRKRVALGCMFALGSFACVTSIIRIKFVSSYGTTIDYTWYYVDVVIWSSIETFTAVICACLMCIRPLISRYFPSAFPSTGNNSSKSWGQKATSGGQHSRQLGRDFESSAEDKSAKTEQPIQLDSNITVTTESRLSFESEYAQANPDMDDHENLVSQVQPKKL
ncbi:uncharacterized protein RCO7_08933 [Rhynchosporium graminicola]|uniref:CFEM domain-containing protein n=1 Tax=Rhynchosporium graminicola TaxID=2792576 RepID=A0A1E1KJW9_9HELO|nr:uncharacterized protein RCO7_08933 [Rhynchosporium commune]